jgi:dipeptidyl aminopeptidase/acylaminoacyl peptidase
MSDGTGEPVLVAPTTGGTFFDASPDGSLLAYTDTAKAGYLGDLSVMPIDGPSSQQTSTGTQQVSIGPVVAFEWSPSGEKLLLLTVNPDGTALIPQIWTPDGVRDYEEVLPTRSMIDQYLPFWDQYIRVLTLWAQDGASFVMPMAGEAGGSIIVYDVETGETTRVIGGRFASWSPAS